MKDFAVVGSGIGGSAIASLLSAKGFNVVLFEKEPYLGGCSSSFKHKGHIYNTGATTLAGYEDGMVVKEVFDAIGFKPELTLSDPSIVVVQGKKITMRHKDFEIFFKNLDANYPHPKNRAFWELILEINRSFYTINTHYYANSNLFTKTKSLFSFFPLFLKFQKYLRVNAKSFIDAFMSNMDAEYLQFLESQILIVAQAPLKEINFFTAALSLGYTFNDNYYANGGFSTIFNAMTKNVQEVYRGSEIKKIIKHKEYFELHTKEGVFEAKKVILNSTVYDSRELFEDNEIKNYYKKYEHLNNHQSSFMLYMTIKSEKKFHHHYQIIKDKTFMHTLSKALFVSFSDVNDTLIAPKGHYSITASIHTDSRFWEDEARYKKQKKELEGALKKTILEELGIGNEEVIACFGATSKTFVRYIKRSQLGGNAMSIKNFLPLLPGNDTKIEGLYNVGDSVYAAQGWPGVMLGVKNLARLLHV